VPAAAVSGPLRRRDIVRSGDCRQTENDSAVLRAALDHGPVARSTIARLAGLSPAAVTRLTADLIAAGLLREAAPVGTGRRGPGGGRKTAGRPHVPVEIDTTRRVACGLHIALRHATLALLDLRGRVLARERVPHLGTDPREVLPRLARRVPEFLAEHAGGREPAGLGVAAGGWVDPEDGVIVEHGLLGWHDVAVRRILEDATGLPVRVDNHARSLALAEQLFGDPRARGSVLHLFSGNMVDAAFATGGQVHHGPQSAAGAVAHLPLADRSEQCACGRRGCLQAAVSSRALGLRAAREGITREPVFDSLLAAARAGDPRAAGLLRERARLLGMAAALLLDVLNPDLLVVTEQGIRHVPGCLEILRSAAAGRSPRGDPGRAVIASSFGDDALPVAAGTVLLGVIYSDPLGRRSVVSRAS
jgi:predicted NBD/HSP70 family sugar kinase